jgi:hypothetical protein
MNQELEALILAYEKVSAARGQEADEALIIFEALIDDALRNHPGISRDLLRKSVIRAHRQWALKQGNKPPAIPPQA